MLLFRGENANATVVVFDFNALTCGRTQKRGLGVSKRPEFIAYLFGCSAVDLGVLCSTGFDSGKTPIFLEELLYLCLREH